MSITVNALNRGGFSTYGRCSYDQREQAIVIQAEAGEVVDITVNMPSTVSSTEKTLYGLDAANATISGSTWTTRLSGIQAGGSMEFDVTLATGEVRKVRFVMARMPGRSSLTYGDSLLTETEEALVLE